MTSPYSSGGGGTQFEARVVAAALTAVLCESPFRGLHGDYATELRTQRANFDAPLDDLILTGTSRSGAAPRLSLQIKSHLTYTAKDAEWADVLRRAWDTFTSGAFDPSHDRVGAGVGSYSARLDQYYLGVLTWAAHSADGNDFFERIEKKEFSHADQRAFVTAISNILGAHLGRALTKDEIWRFLRVLVIIHFDFETGENSRDEISTIERLRAFLPTGEQDQAANIWNFLIRSAADLVPVGGSASRATLVSSIKSEGLPVGTAPSLAADIATLNRESLRTLADIRDDIAGIKLPRTKLRDAIAAALSSSRFLQLVGEPGTGKSAMLKAMAEESATLGPIFVLKDGRIHPRGWSSHAHALKITDDISRLLREFSCSGVPLLFIDGIDKISEAAEQVTVNDILRAVVDSNTLEEWRVLVTVREQNLKHLDTWLDGRALQLLKLSTIVVEPLQADEKAIVAENIPRLAPLLRDSGELDVVLNRPFFLNAMAKLGATSSAGAMPATEVELLQLWWRLGGADKPDEAESQARRNTLIALGHGLIASSGRGIPISDLQPVPLSELKVAGVLIDKEFGHTVAFSHDIYEEWALCELLLSERGRLKDFLLESGEQNAFVRPVQLLATYLLETNSSTDDWKAVLKQTETDALRPVWARAVLTSCFQSTRAALLLGKLSAELLADDGSRLKKLLLAITTIEVTPNTQYLNEAIFPDKEPAERARFAQLMAVPKPFVWVRFLDWLVPILDGMSTSLIPDLLPALISWQELFAGRNVRHCREIALLSHNWLLMTEAALHPGIGNWSDRKRPFGEDLSYRDEEKAEKQLRKLFFASTAEVPDLVRAYLKEKAGKENRLHSRDTVIENFAPLVRHLPTEFVDFILTAFLDKPDDHRDEWGSYHMHLAHSLGIGGSHEFYPSSPAQPPFLLLLRLHETEGLRLIRELCNHSVSVWKWLKSERTYDHSGLTPLSVDLDLPWGRQSFWGDGQVYLWFRGYWGSDAVKSGLMALEQWALERIDAGDPFEAVFRKVIEGNSSVAALGLGVSLCLAHPKLAQQAALPLVICPYLWMWDIARLVQDSGGMPPNELGDWYRYGYLLKPVREANQRPHRKQDIRALVPMYLFSQNGAVRKKYLRGLRSFPKRLPFVYEEERSAAEHVAELKERMTLFAEQGDPKYLRSGETEDGKQIQVWVEPPSLQKPRYQAQAAEHRTLNEYMRLALWATKTLEEEKLQPGYSLDQAIEEARKLDSETLFDRVHGADEMLDQQRSAAVVGTAAVFARYASEQQWKADIGAWAIDVFERAATAPEVRDELSYRGTHLIMYPASLATQGYSALLARGFEPRRCMSALLSLAIDAMEDVVATVFASAKLYAASQPKFFWTLLSAGMSLCLVARDKLPNYHSPHWDDGEAADKLAVLEEAEKAIDSGIPLELPHIPLPWTLTGNGQRRGRSDTKGYSRADLEFMFHLAPKVLFACDLDELLKDQNRREQILRLTGELLAWTADETIPPFSDRRRRSEGNPPFEWIYSFSRWCGRLSAKLTATECQSAILSPIWKLETETALLIMQSLMRSFMVQAFLVAPTAGEDQLAVWNQMAGWLFNSPEWKHGKATDRLDREFQSCAQSLLFCVSQDFGPLICGLEKGAGKLPPFAPVVEKAIREFGMNVDLYYVVMVFLKGGGFDLLPQPALGWLKEIVTAKRQDLKFWESNGHSTVELFGKIVSDLGPSLPPEDRQTVIYICDVLVDNGVRGAGFLQQELQRFGSQQYL